MLRKFNPAGAPPPPFYSQGVEATGIGKLVFVSGQVGVRPDGMLAEGIVEQTQAAAANLKAVLAEAGMTLDDVTKYTIYLTDQSLFEGFTQGAGGLLASPPAAATMLYVKALAAPGMLVEIEAIAAK